MNKYWKHFKTVTTHKFYVSQACFKAGLIRQGIMHDISKYSITEFTSSARFFQGHKSPIDAEKIENGYSLAWQNHKGHNRHHWQYWTDFEKGELVVIEMPAKYVGEMLCDWVGAGKAYNKGKWTVESFKSWYEGHRDTIVLHPNTREYIEHVVAHVQDEEDLYRWAKVKRITYNKDLLAYVGVAYPSKVKVSELAGAKI